MFDFLRGIAEGIINLADNIVSGLKDAIVEPILNGIKAIFVPDEDFISAKFDDLKSNFSFVYSITETFEQLKELLSFSSDSAPVIELTLPQNISQYGYYYGDQTVTIDFSWYESYKPYVDNILSALILFGFLWRQYHKLPETIKGIDGSVVNLSHNTGKGE